MMSEPASRIAERMLTRPEGATMDELIAATGGPQYNVLRRLAARGHSVRKIREDRVTRYFVEAPQEQARSVSVSSKGQLTLPRDIREQLGVTYGGEVRLSLAEDGRTFIAPANLSVTRLAGMFGKPRRHFTLEQLKRAREEAVAEKYRRSFK
jgi:bifunctional DNA-binding transcriptional regulator/antitoxin component of YhaV-PrlF toxin-antitoxin module